MTDTEFETRLDEIRRFLYEGNKPEPEHIAFLKANAGRIERYYAKKYYDIFDVCPKNIRALINDGMNVADGKHFTPTIRQAFKICDEDITAFCGKHKFDVRDDVFDLLKAIGR